MKRTLAALALGVLAVSVTGCGDDPLDEGSGGSGGGGGGGGGDTIVVGSADFPESELLAEIYAAALEQAGLEVDVNPRLGTREITNQGLQDGSITVMPEYTGNLLQSFDQQATATAPDEVYTALQQAVPDGLEVLEMSEAEDSDVLVVTQETSDRLGLTSMDQLGPVCGQLTLGAAGEWQDRWGDRIVEVYDCIFREFRPTDAGGPVTIEALRSGDVQMVNLFTTAPDIEANGWVQLEDPQNMYPAQNIVPIIRSGEVNQAGIDALNEVSAALTTGELTELNRRVAEDREVPADLAQEFVGGLG